MTTTTLELTTVATWQEAVQSDLQRIEDKMRQSARIGSEQLDPAVDAIIRAGGKRLRPAVAILAGRLFEANWEAIEAVSASIELLHTATLIHDDLVDDADARRGVPTLHSLLPIGITVLTGDFIFAKSAALAAEADNVRVVKLFAETLVRICQGEILQAQTRWKVPTQAIYTERIYGKTAALFEAASASGAILGGAPEREISALAQYGRELGIAFQIIDDALDFESTTERLGKPAGNDMRQGIFNLPVMFYVQEGYTTEAELSARVEAGEGLDELVADMRAAGMIEKSIEVAKYHARTASNALLFKNGDEVASYLHDIADYALARAY